ncbi:MAG: histidine kinase [Rhizobium sp.]|nr:MAG: histidine kinase [Rhizobium sp.]
MIRIGLSARLVAIVGASLLAIWVMLLSSVYLANDLRSATALPAPEQVAAIVDIVRQTEPTRRPRLIQAFNSAILELRLEDDLAGSNAGIDVDVMSDERFEPYRKALGENLLAVTMLARNGERSRMPRLFGGDDNPIEFAVALEGANVLILETRTPFLVTWFGLPVGLGAGLLGSLFAVIAVLVLHRELRPLRRLAAAVDQMDPAAGPVPVPDVRFSAPETRTLVQAFARLQTRLHAMIAARLALIGGIQHDVRTFATRLRLRAEQIPDEAERDRAIADIGDMIQLLDNALLAGRAGVGSLDEELLEIAPIVESEILESDIAVENRTLAVRPAAASAMLIGDRLALRRIVSNLVGNAIKYGRAAHVALDVEGRWIVLTVDDDGPGIAAADRELLFEPFVRLEASRARKTGGAGLGLAVVRSLVEAQGGDIAVGDAPGGGARFTVRLPLFSGLQGAQ